MRDERSPHEPSDCCSLIVDGLVPSSTKMQWQSLQSLTRCLLRGSCLSLCLLTLVALDARTAWASCGDYLAGHGGHAMNGHPSSSHDLVSHPASRLPQPRPTCSGPQCHQRQQPAPAAPSRQMEVPQSNDAVLCVIARLATDDACASRFPATFNHAVAGPASRLFRPPRAC